MTPLFKSHHRAHRFEATPESLEHLEGAERRESIPCEVIVSRMALSSREYVLDLGAGIGYFAFPMAERAREVVALDIEPKMLAIITSRAKERGVHNIRTVLGEMGAVPSGDGLFDHVLAAFVYHEVADQAALLSECARVLRPMGFLTVIDFQKRRTKGEGPPVRIRKTPEQVEHAASRWFSHFARFDEEVYYQLEFRKR